VTVRGQDLRIAAPRANACPHELRQRVSLFTGEVRKARCRRHWCGDCGPQAVLTTSRAVALAEPTRSVVFTNAGSSPREVSPRIYRVTERLRARGVHTLFAWVVHKNPGRPGFHAHAFQRGSYLDFTLMQELAARVGMGQVHLDALRDPWAYSFYAMIERPGLLPALQRRIDYEHAETLMDRYVSWNGRKLLGANRGFLVDARGQSTRIRKARRDGVRAYRKSHPSRPGRRLRTAPFLSIDGVGFPNDGERLEDLPLQPSDPGGPSPEREVDPT
jgi:hypothetical protein